jgi:hypothetical protein
MLARGLSGAHGLTGPGHCTSRPVPGTAGLGVPLGVHRRHAVMVPPLKMPVLSMPKRHRAQRLHRRQTPGERVAGRQPLCSQRRAKSDSRRAKTPGARGSVVRWPAIGAGDAEQRPAQPPGRRPPSRHTRRPESRLPPRQCCARADGGHPQPPCAGETIPSPVAPAAGRGTRWSPASHRGPLSPTLACAHAAVAGCGSMRDHSKTLSLAPRLPSRLTRLSIGLLYHARRLRLDYAATPHHTSC